MGKKGDLSDFEHRMVVGARRGGLSISQTTTHTGSPKLDNRRLEKHCLV